MQTVTYKLAEFFLIFIIAPICFTLSFPTWVKMSIGVFGFAYIVFVLLKIEKNKFNVNPNLDWDAFLRQTIMKLIAIVFVTTVFMLFTIPRDLFVVILNKPKLWGVILFVYSLFSVYPQELIYRTFYFQRYEALFNNKKLFLFINAIIFSLAHLFFRNTLVIGLTFLGGLLFAFTFNKTRSTLLVTVEHAIYGCWLFTVGMGSMLGFPC